MALGADRYASRADTLVFIGCMLLSIAAMSLPDRWRDPLAKGLRQTVLAPFLWLQQQTGLLAASLSSYDGVVAQRDSAALAATFLPELRAENTRLLELRGIPYRQSVALGTSILTSGLGGVFPRGIPLGSVVDSAAAEEGWERTYLVRPAVHPSAVSHVMILTGGRSGAAGDLRAVFGRGEQGP